MRPFGHLTPLENAIEAAVSLAIPLERREQVSLWEAVGRVLAQVVTSPLDVPTFDKASMDGFALRSGGTAAKGSRLRVVGVSHAGEVFSGKVGPQECVEVATGAPVPEDCDSVIEVESVAREEGEVLLQKEVKAGRNVSPRGQDIRKGDILVEEGVPLRPGHLGAISALGIQEVTVFERPAVAIFATGREIRRQGKLGPGEVYDANSSTLAGLLMSEGAKVTVFDPVPDEYQEIVKAVSRAREFDLVVLSGSTSVGERDYLRDAVESEGEIVFHGIAARPGKPLLLGKVGRGLVFGMPGFPASCLLLAYHALLPVYRRIARLPGVQGRMTLPLAEDLHESKDLTQLVTVHLEGGKAHRAFHHSGSITSVSRGEGYVVVEPGRRFRAGDPVEVLLF